MFTTGEKIMKSNLSEANNPKNEENTIEEFINWIEENTIIEINLAPYSDDKYKWIFYNNKKNDWNSSEDTFDTKLDALKDLLEKIRRIKLVK
jgi:hypothetical protein